MYGSFSKLGPFLRSKCWWVTGNPTEQHKAKIINGQTKLELRGEIRVTRGNRYCFKHLVAANTF